MHILGVNIRGKNWGINQIYIRCMGALTVFAGTILAPFSPAIGGQNDVNIITPGIPNNSVTMKYYRTKFGMKGTMTVHNEPVFTSTGCISGWCYVEAGNESDRTNCKMGWRQEMEWIGVGGCFWQEANSFEGTGGFIYSRSTSLFASWGCKSGEITGYNPSGTGSVTSGVPECFYEEVDLPTRCYSASCAAGHVNAIPFSGFCVPESILYRTGPLSDSSCATSALLRGPVLIDEGSGSYVLYETGINLDAYCTYGGCSGIELTDANGNYKTVNGADRFNPDSGPWGTVSWNGLPPNCTAKITSVKADGTSTDSKGVWEKSCTYSN